MFLIELKNRKVIASRNYRFFYGFIIQFIQSIHTKGIIFYINRNLLPCTVEQQGTFYL